MDLLVYLGNKHLGERLKEPSTWKGLAILAGLLGWSVSPELAEAIGATVVGVIGIIEVVRKEKAGN